MGLGGGGVKDKRRRKQSGTTAMKKSESCSCACGRITTSSVLNTHKHQTKYRIFLRQYGGDNEDEGVASTSLEQLRDFDEADRSN